MEVIMANNINTLVSSNNGVQSGATIVGRENSNNTTISNLNKASSIYSGNSRQKTTQASNDSLNRTASLYSGNRRSMYDDNNNNNASNSSSVVLPEPDEDLYNEFMNTVAPYVKMSDDEKKFYYQISSQISANGGDASSWAQDFLSTNAIANVLGVSRSEVNQNRGQMLNYYLGIEEDKPLDFTTGGTLINSINQGKRQQDMAKAQEELLGLYKKGYDENTPEVKQLVGYIQQKEQEMNYFQDYNPRWWTTEWAKISLSQLAYMGVGTAVGTLAGIAGDLVGGALFGPVGAVKGFQIASGLARFLTYDKQFAASAFWNMKQAGVSTETALKYSNIDGFINGLNEAFLDVGYSQVMGGVGKLVGVKDLGGKIVPTIVSRVVKDGTLAGWLGSFLLYMGLDASGEFVQESTQSLTSSALQAIAEATDGIPYSSSIQEALSSAWEEGIQGFATGLFFSGFGSGINVLADIRSTSKLKNNSVHSYSKEAYVNSKENRNLVQSLKLGGSELSEDNVSNLLSKLYDSTQKVREDIKSNIRKEIFDQLKNIDSSLNENILDGVDISTGEIKDKDGNVISGKNTEVKRKSDGSTYFIVDKEESQADDGKEHYTMRIANPNVVGTSRLGEIYVDAKTAEYNNALLDAVKTSPNALAMEQAGAIQFTLDDENKTLSIESVNVQDDNASLKEQAIRDLMQMYSDYSIEWNNRTQSDNAVFSTIESSNPRNTSTNTYGLNYTDNSKTTEEQSDRAYVRRWLGNSFSEDASENDFMATILQAAAKARGLSGQAFIEKYFTEIRESENKDANVKGYTRTNRDELSKQVKATIYAGKSADPTTFLHELNHVIILMGDNRQEFTSVFNKVKGTKQFMSFVKSNMDILRYVIGKTDDKGVYVLENGKYVLDEAKLQSLFQDANNWTRDDFEFEARLYEAYMRSGQTLNPTLTGFFRRVAETFRRIYTALRNGISSSQLNDEVVAYFDKLYGYDASTGTTSVLKDNGELHNIGKLDQTTDEEEKKPLVLISTLPPEEQFAAIKKKYYGTDKYMIAPNGKATNLTEEQWILVRTPNFIKWFGDWINDPQNASKVVDKNGEPLVVYHGTRRFGFDTFNDRQNKMSDAPYGSYWFSSDKDVAHSYSGTDEIAKIVSPYTNDENDIGLNDNPGNYACFLYIKDPKTKDFNWNSFDGVGETEKDSLGINANDVVDEVKTEGKHDGVILSRIYDEGGLYDVFSPGTDYVVFDPNQIKSATENNGNFSTTSDSILEQTDDGDFNFGWNPYKDYTGGGYNREKGMSNRAVDAYENGEKPLSKWTKAEIDSAIKNDEDITKEVADALLSLPLKAKKTLLYQSSWHHTGLRYNRTDFYSLKYLGDFTVEDVERFKNEWNQYEKDKKEYPQKIEEARKNLKQNQKLVVQPFATFVYTYGNVFEDVEIPSVISEFAKNNLEYSMKGNAYLWGQKPSSAEVPNGLERLELQWQDKNGAIISLTKYNSETEKYETIESVAFPKAAGLGFGIKTLSDYLNGKYNNDSSLASEVVAELPMSPRLYHSEDDNSILYQTYDDEKDIVDKYSSIMHLALSTMNMTNEQKDKTRVKLRKMLGLPENGDVSVNQITYALSKYYKSVAEEKDFSDYKNSKNAALFSDILAKQIKDRVKVAPENSAVGWYSEKIDLMHSIVGEAFPEINSDPNGAGFIFDVLVAMTSQGQTVEQNFDLAINAYESYKKTGLLPTDAGNGMQANATNNNIGKINAMLLGGMSIEDIRQFFEKQWTGAELRDRGYDVATNMEEKDYGSIILGPKIGGAFFSNIRGNHEIPTLDKWMSRVLFPFTGYTYNKKILGSEKDAIGFETFTNPDRKFFLDVANDVRKKLKRNPNFKGITVADIQAVLWYNIKTLYDAIQKQASTSLGTDYATASAKVFATRNADELGLTGKKRKEWINDEIQRLVDGAKHRRVQEGIQDEGGHKNLGSTGMDTNLSEILPDEGLGVGTQALGETSEQGGVAENRQISEGTSSSNSSQRYVSLYNDGQRHEADLSRRRGDLASVPRVLPWWQSGTRSVYGLGVRNSSFLTEVKTFINNDGSKTYNPVRIIPFTDNSFVRVAYSQEMFVGRELADYISVNTEGHVALPDDISFLEISRDKSGKTYSAGSFAFVTAMNKAVENLKAQDKGRNLTVDVPTVNDINNGNYKLYLSSDGKAGFALHGDEIKAVFADPSFVGASYMIMPMAIALGGRRLDCFDGKVGLQNVYARFGFKPVARIEFSYDAFEDNAIKRAWKKQVDNLGKPDVYFMVLDKNTLLSNPNFQKEGFVPSPEEIPLIKGENNYSEALQMAEEIAKATASDFGSDMNLVTYKSNFIDTNNIYATRDQIENSLNKTLTKVGNADVKAIAEDTQADLNNKLLQTAYHGSPNEIIGELSTKYMGTGEGHQIHGWGLYFAQSENISKERYIDRLVSKRINTDAQKIYAKGKELSTMEVLEHFPSIQRIKSTDSFFYTVLKNLSDNNLREKTIEESMDMLKYKYEHTNAVVELLEKSLQEPQNKEILKEIEKKWPGTYLKNEEIRKNKLELYKKTRDSIKNNISFLEEFKKNPNLISFKEASYYSVFTINGKKIEPYTESATAELYGKIIDYSLENNLIKEPEGEISFSAGLNRKIEEKFYQGYFKSLFDEGKLIPLTEKLIKEGIVSEGTLDVAKSINSVEVKAPTYGSILTVDIPEDDVLLDEEKGFGAQSPFVQNAIKRLYANEFGIELKERWGGADIYYNIQNQIAKKTQSPENLPKQASLMLAKYGIEGITYVGGLDGRCFVIFTDDAIKQVDSRLYQIGDSEWTETAKRIAYEATSLDDFFKKYREQVEDGNIELTDENVSQLLTSIYDEAEQETYDPPVEGYFDEDEDTSSLIDEDWTVEEVERPTEEESTASSSTTNTTMSDEVPDWFDLTDEEIASLNKDAEATETNTQELEKYTSDIQRVVVDADLPKGLSLDHSRSLDTSSHARAIEFANILKGSKEQTIEFLKTLREVNNEFFYNDGVEYNEAVDEESYQAKTIRESAFNNFKNMSKFIQNLVYESRGSQYRNLDNITDRAWKIVAGQVAANPDVYMDLYSRASGNTEWSGENSIEARVLSEIGLTERDWNDLSYSKRKEYIQYIEDKDIRKRILTGDLKDVDLKGYIERTEKRAEASLSEAKALEESQKYIIDENKKTILKLGTEAQNYQKQIAEIEKEKAEIQEKLERNVKKMENKLKNANMDTSNTLVHADLLKRMTELNRREAQYQKALRMWQKGSSTVTQDDLARIRGLIEDARNKIEELQKSEEITPEEAIKRLQNLYNAWKDAKTKETIDKLKDKYNVRLSNLRQTKNEAIVETRKRYMQIMKEREALRRIRSEKERLVKQIMKAPSANIAREEARQIKALQLLIDPAFRRGTIKALDGKVYTVAELKEILTKNSSDPVIQTLTERQIERLTKVSLDEMTLTEVEETYRYIKQLREEGLNKRRSEILKRKAEEQIIYNELTNTLMASKKFADYGFEGTEDKKNRLNTKSGKVRNAWYQTLNMARKAQILDNNEKGTFYNLLIRKKRILQNAEMEAVSKRANLIQDAIKENNLNPDSLYKTWTMNLEDGRTVTFTTSELAYIYLSQYCQENREALAYGTFVSIDEKSAFQNGANSTIIGVGKELQEARDNKINEDIRRLGDWRYNEALTLAKTVIEGDKGIYNLVKAIESDFNSADFQRVIDLTRKIYNVDIKKEDYYLPLNRTDFLGKDPGEDIKNDLLNTVPGTKGVVEKGFTKERNKTISPLHQKAIKYDLFKVWTESVKKQEHFIAMQEYINQLNSLLVSSDKAKLLRSRIENTYGKTMLENLDEYIKEVANPDAGALQLDPTKDILNAAKGNIYAAYLGFKLSSITNQLITSPAAFLGKVSPIRLASNLLQMIVHYKSISEEVFELSPFMKSRNFDLIAGEIKESSEKLGLNKAQRGWNKFLEVGLKGLEFADQFSVVAGWKAIFDQELEKLGGETEENVRTAAAIADEYVYETQPLSDKSEIAPLFKNKSGFTNIMLQFQTSLNVVWNNLAYDTVQDFKKKNWRKAAGTVFGYAMAGSLLALAHGEFKPDDDDDEDEKLKKFWLKFGYSTLSQGIESIPIFSNVVDPIFRYIVTDEKPSYTSNMITPFPFIANASEATKYTVQAIREKDTEALTKAVDKGADAFMLALGLPYSAIREIEAIKDVGAQALLGERK